MIPSPRPGCAPEVVPVSVVIPAYNAAATICRALDSVRAQTARPAEVLIVDDGSSDSTTELVRGFTDLPVRLIISPGRGGAARARNLGIREAAGEFVAFLDADDEWSSDKLEKQLQMIKPRPDMSFVACRSHEFSLDGSLLSPVHDGVPVVTGTEAWRALLAANFISTPCVLARRQALLTVGGFNPAYPVAEDQDLWIRLALVGELGFVDESLVTVHASPSSLSLEYRQQEPDIALAMVVGHIERQRGRMTREELRYARRLRFAQNGRRYYMLGRRLRGLRYLAAAVLNGQPISETVRFMVAAAPGVSWLRTTLLGRRS